MIICRYMAMNINCCFNSRQNLIQKLDQNTSRNDYSSMKWKLTDRIWNETKESINSCLYSLKMWMNIYKSELHNMNS